MESEITNIYFSEEEIEQFLKRKQDLLDGKTTARDWHEIEEELNQRYDLK
jgi:hypothetical protein